MEILQSFVQEQQAMSLVALGLVSLAVAFAFRRFVGPGQTAIGLNRAFWLSQVLLGSSGAAMILWPSFGFAAVLAAVVGCVVLVRQLDQASRRRRSDLA